jgi:acetyl esterase/lipase
MRKTRKFVCIYGIPIALFNRHYYYYICLVELSSMLKYMLVSCMALCISLPVICRQAPPVRFRDMVFAGVTTQKDLSYLSDTNKEIKKKHYLFDLYEPIADSSQHRPLIIWLHGGGFKFGSKKSRGTPIWSKTFARRGYVCAAINYRLSKQNTLGSFKALVNGCSDAVADVLQAIRYFKAHHAQYRIDTSHIILAGNSAGGMIALHAVYSSFRELALEADSTDTAAATAPVTHNPANVVAVVNFWGAIFNADWLQNAWVPIVSAHGKKDRVVPYDKLGPLYGSFAIHQKADSLQIPNRLKTFRRQAHELQTLFNPFWAGNTAKGRWRQAGTFAAEFLYEQLFSDGKLQNVSKKTVP